MGKVSEIGQAIDFELSYTVQIQVQALTLIIIMAGMTVF